MIECNVNNISKTFSEDLLFENINFDIKTNERIGIVGPNGSGKTTLLKIIYGIENIQTGSVSFRKDSKIGYLHQIPDFSEHTTVVDILYLAFEHVFEIRNKMTNLEEQFSLLQDEELNKALKEYTRLTDIFEQLDGYNIETNINKVTTGLKIPDTMKNQNFNVLSGGEKTRVMLAKILLEHPTLLMLDEPSNHLDLESIEWLENYLKTYSGSVIIVSHDRYFLDNVCQKIVEISTYKAHVYHGNYSYYVIEKERRFLLELKAYLSQQKKIKRMEEQIKRYRIWGEMRDSDKMFKRAKELEKRLEKVERLDKPKTTSKVKLSLQNTSRSGKRVLEAFNISKSFGENHLFDGVDLELIYQDRIAILGNNGTGKTTLIRLLHDDFFLEEPLYKWGSKLNVGYLAQEVSFEDENVSILDYFMKKHNVNQNKARSELAKALFIRDDVLKKIKVLSGGEKSKLILCSLLFNQVNFLILDEPTNHLDIDSREILEEMLLEFEGTILFISHDRYFIKKIATRIAEIENKKLTFYEGDFDYFRSMKKERLISKPKKEKKKRVQKEKTVDLDAIYIKLEKLEQSLKDIDHQMIEFGRDSIKLQELYDEKERLEQQHTELYLLLESEE